jgi:hypothetical protein
MVVSIDSKKWISVLILRVYHIEYKIKENHFQSQIHFLLENNFSPSITFREALPINPELLEQVL